MAEVNPRYTEISVEECVRIANQLTKNLEQEYIYCDYRMQGSVPCNTHIRGVSDVDFLVIIKDKYYFDASGPKANQYHPYSGNLLQDIVDLRNSCESVLDKQFPAAKIDKNGKKSIKISGGSLRREVDIVPSAWFNSISYQHSGHERDRGVDILDRSVPKTIRNFPFLHIHHVNDRGTLTIGGLKMSVRLIKNIKNDSDRSIRLSSYELAGLMWNCPPEWLMWRSGYDLLILVGTEKYLSALSSNYELTKDLKTPDGTRYIIDSPEKFDALVALSQEVTEITETVFSELPNSVRLNAGYDVTRRRLALSESYLP